MTLAEDLAERVLETMSYAGVRIDPGLFDSELHELETVHGFRFAPEHAALLRLGVPVGPGWPRWRGSSVAMHRELARPVDGVVRDVLEHGFWPRSWGLPPVRASERAAVARARLATVPRLVPVFGRRYLAALDAAAPVAHCPVVALADRGRRGFLGPFTDTQRLGPVLSVHRTDVCVAGGDLLDWVDWELSSVSRRDEGEDERGEVGRVRFWSDFVDGPEVALEGAAWWGSSAAT